MGLSSLFKRSVSPAAEPVQAPDAVATARTRARRRLIGATVLLGIGVIGFPLLFETQPRPIPVDIPIEIPRKDGAPPLVLPPAAAASAAVVAPKEAPAHPAPAASSGSPPATAVVASAPAPVPAPTAAPKVIETERAADQGRELPPPAASVPAAARPTVAAVDKPKPAVPASAAPRPAADDGARARALLEGKPTAEASARVVVQVGAYTDADRLREARQKVEKLGLKTYTQVIEADGGKRTRVRVGPFASRAEADKIAARIKAAGLPASILTL